MKSPIEIYIVNKIKERRISAKLSQRELAELLGVSIGFVGQVESDNYTTKYNFNHLNNLAKIFNCSVKDFFPEEPIN